MTERIDLLVIDPENDFCSPDAASKKGTSQEGDGIYEGTLYVPGAEKDMARLATMVTSFGLKIKKIHVTLDCHHRIDVAHPLMWRDSDGNNPDPFTVITAQEIRDGVWTPVFPNLRQRFIDYCEALEASKRYPLTIWNTHCLIGTIGSNVIPVLADALEIWETNKLNNVDYVSKGSNPFTEHYSAVKAEVPDPEDPSTQLNTKLIQTLMEADKILIAGEAGSHCVANTVRDIADGFQDDTYIQKMILLEDAVSPVISPFVDYPAEQAKFIAEMVARGMKIAKTTDF